MSDPASKIRIGKEHFNYVYTYQGNGIYKCVRGSDWCEVGECLWLMRDDNGWYAFDGPQDGRLPTEIPHDKVRFSTKDLTANLPGRHVWAMTMSDNEEGGFDTTKLED